MKKAFFDQAAKAYDASFTNSIIGQLQRKRVYFWLNQSNFFSHISSVFEINCGTGYDAEVFYQKGLEVRATDVSKQMIEIAKKNRSKHIQFSQLDFNDIDTVNINEEAVFSNFGGLNCISKSKLKEVSNAIGSKQKQGDTLVWVIMPKFSLMESLYLFVKLKWKLIWRRCSTKPVMVNVDGVDVPTYFHSPKEIKQILKPNYTIKLLKPVALFLPPSYLEPLAKRYPGAIKFLDKLEFVFGRFSFFAGWSDHFIIIAQKK